MVALVSRTLRGRPAAGALPRRAARGGTARPVLGAEVLPRGGGDADIYARFGPTMEWDSAAGQAIVEAAGGAVVDLDAAPLRYGKAGWRNPDFVCHGGA
jgi:hypothetical protein